MKQLLLIPVRYPLWVLALLLSLSLVVRISAEGMLARDDPARALYDQAAHTFGSGETVVLYLEAPELFLPATLQRIGNAVKAFDALPFVSRTDSLYSIPDLRTVDNILSTSAYLHEIPASPEQARTIRERVLSNPFVRRNLLSDNGRSMAINLHLLPDYASRYSDRDVISAIEAIAAPLRRHLVDVFHTGPPRVRDAMSRGIREEQQQRLVELQARRIPIQTE